VGKYKSYPNFSLNKKLAQKKFNLILKELHKAGI